MRSIAVMPEQKELALVEQRLPRLESPGGVMLRRPEVRARGTDREALRALVPGRYPVETRGDLAPGPAGGITNVIVFA
jgi:hypothetical protein